MLFIFFAILKLSALFFLDIYGDDNLKNKMWLAFFVIICFCSIVSGCSFPGLQTSSEKNIKIAAQSTTEGQVMAEVIKTLIEHDTNYKATIINNLGSGNMTFAAQQRGDADLSAVRYTGTDLATVMNKSYDRSQSPRQIDQYVHRYFKRKYHMTYFPTYGFANTYTWIVTPQYAKKNHLKNVSDLKPLASKMDVGIDDVWKDRKGDGYQAFTKLYGYSFDRLRVMQNGLFYQAVAKNKVDAVLGYSTDGRIAGYHLKTLKDDKRFFPPYSCSVVANDSALKKYPQLRRVLAKLNGQVSLKTMQKLNYQVENDLEEPQTVAHRFVKNNNYFN